MTSPALRLVIEPHHLKHSRNISLLIARHTFEDSFLTLLHRAFSTGGEEHQQGSNEPLLIAGYTEESSHRWKPDSKRACLSQEPDSKRACLSEPEKHGEARVLESEEEREARAELKSPVVGRPRGPLRVLESEEEGEARVELEIEGEAQVELKSPDVGRPRGPLVSKKLTIPDLCLFDDKGRVLFVIEVCIILPVPFSYFQSPIYAYLHRS